MPTRTSPLCGALSLCVLACAHSPKASVRRVPLRVAEGVLASPMGSALQAQKLRDGLVLALAADHFCLETYGDFEALLNLRAEVDGGGRAVITLTIDKGAATAIDELTEKLPVLRATAEEAQQAVQPLLRDLERSGALRDLAGSAKL